MQGQVPPPRPACGRGHALAAVICWLRAWSDVCASLFILCSYPRPRFEKSEPKISLCSQPDSVIASAEVEAGARTALALRAPFSTCGEPTFVCKHPQHNAVGQRSVVAASERLAWQQRLARRTVRSRAPAGVAWLAFIVGRALWVSVLRRSSAARWNEPLLRVGTLRIASV